MARRPRDGRPRTTLDAAHKLHPKARKVIAPVNSNVTGFSNRRLLQSVIPAFNGIFEFELVEDPELEPFLQHLKGLRKDEHIILLTGRLGSSAGEMLYVAEECERICC